MSSPPFIDLASCVTKRLIRGNASQRVGLYYERAVLRWFSERFALCAPQPEIWEGSYVVRRPDLLVFDDTCSRCVVVEVKNTFHLGAVKQAAIYVNYVRRWMPALEVRSLVVCANISVSEDVEFVSIKNLFTLGASKCNVFVLSRRELRLGTLDGSFVAGEAPLRSVGFGGNPVRSRNRVSRMAAKVRTGSAC